MDGLKYSEVCSKDFACFYYVKVVLRDEFTGSTIVTHAKTEDENTTTMISRGINHIAMIRPKHDRSNFPANCRSRPEYSLHDFESCYYDNCEFIECHPTRIQISMIAQNNVRLIDSRLVAEKDIADAWIVETSFLCDLTLILKKHKSNTLLNT